MSYFTPEGTQTWQTSLRETGLLCSIVCHAAVPIYAKDVMRRSQYYSLNFISSYVLRLGK